MLFGYAGRSGGSLRYEKGMAARPELKGVRLQQAAPGDDSVWWINAALLPEGLSGEQVGMQLMKSYPDIEIRPGFFPLDMMAIFQSSWSKPCENSRLLYQRLVCLPSSNQLQQEDVERVCTALVDAIQAGTYEIYGGTKHSQIPLGPWKRRGVAEIYVACLTRTKRPFCRLLSFGFLVAGLMLKLPQASIRASNPGFNSTADLPHLILFMCADILDHIGLVILIYWDICTEAVHLVFALDPKRFTWSLKLCVHQLWQKLPEKVPRHLKHRLTYAQIGLTLLMLITVTFCFAGVLTASVELLRIHAGFLYMDVVVTVITLVVNVLLGGEVYLTLKHIWRRHLNRHGPLHSQLVQEVIHAGVAELSDVMRSVQTQPPVWKRGLAFAVADSFLDMAVDDCGPDLKTTDLCMRWLKPLTLPARCSIWEAFSTGFPKLYGANYPQVSHQSYGLYIGQPTVMVSHCWASSYWELMLIMKRFDENTQSNNLFFLDVFAMNQHDFADMTSVQLNGSDTTMLRALTRALDLPGRVLLAMTPHQQPLLLTRSWCLYEIYIAWKVGAEVYCGFIPEAEQSVKHSLLDTPRRVARRREESDALINEMLSAVDAEKSRATVESDREMILSMISKAGVDRFNSFVQEKLSASLRMVALSTLLMTSEEPPPPALDRCAESRSSPQAWDLTYGSVLHPLTRPSSMGGLWEVVGGSEKGGVLVRTADDSNIGRLSTGALLEELGREDSRREASKRSLHGARSSTGGRLSTGALVRELELKEQRLRFLRLTGTGPETGWASIRLQDGQPLLEPLDFSQTAEAERKSVYDGIELDLNTRNEAINFSYDGLGSWVPWVAAVARLWRQQKPFLPTRLPESQRREQKKLPPHRTLNGRQLEEMGRGGLETDGDGWRRWTSQRVTWRRWLLDEMTKQRLPGCLYGLTFPQSSEEMASEAFGAEWLTKAFHCAGTLPKDNRVVKILRAEELPVKGFDAAGGAAMKMILSVEYAKPDAELHTELFCKYPYSMEQYPLERKQLSSYGDVDGPEILVQMCLTQLFPFRTAKFYFGEEKIEFSRRGRVENGKIVEEIDYKPYQVLPVCGKYQDWLLPNPAEYYCCLFRAMGRLAAWDKQGPRQRPVSAPDTPNGHPNAVGRYDEYFGPLDRLQLLRLSAQRRAPLKRAQLASQRSSIARILDTAIDFLTNVVPSMVPAWLLEGGRLMKIKDEILETWAEFLESSDRNIREMFHHFPAMSGQFQINNPDYISAMHANLQADNAFFWRDEYGNLDCGVLDWGGFSRTPFCMNFMGCLSGADPEVMMAHEEGIIRCFRDEYERCGGPALPVEEMIYRRPEGKQRRFSAGGLRSLCGKVLLMKRPGYHLGYITFVYESTTWLDREIYKLVSKEEMKSWDGILDHRFQDNFRVRCRSATIINTFTFYAMKGDYFKNLFQDWCHPDLEHPEVVQSLPEGLLVSSSPASSSKASSVPSRGSVLEHEGSFWVNVFEVDKYWFASPLPGSAGKGAKARWTGLEEGSIDVVKLVQCLKRPTPLQAERAQLSTGLNSGVLAVDVLAPIGAGQSMLICGPEGAGKSTLASQVMEQVLLQRHVDQAIRFASDPCCAPLDTVLHRAGALQQLVALPDADSAGHADASAALLPALWAAVAAAEDCRTSGQTALLVLDTLAPLLDAWRLAVSMAEEAPAPHIPCAQASGPQN
eukprot:g24877.t1